MNLLPLGTVIKIEKFKALIIGYSSVEKENESISGYLVASYPLGFTNINKVVFLPYDFEFEVLAEGYKTKTSDKVLNMLSKCLDITKDVSYEDLDKFNNEYKKILARIKEAE